eukprot:749596-Hanusia_phi.AAC.2
MSFYVPGHYPVMIMIVYEVQLQQMNVNGFMTAARSMIGSSRLERLSSSVRTLSNSSKLNLDKRQISVNAFRQAGIHDCGRSGPKLAWSMPGRCDVNMHSKHFNAYGFCGKRLFRSSSPKLAKDLYEILGVPKSASSQEIKKAYFQKAKKLHPDVNKDDPKAQEKFSELNNAYEILSDEQKRRMYDMGGMDANGNAAGGFGGFEGFQGFQNFGGDPSDIFEDLSSMFGGRRQNSRRGAGKDVNVQINLSFMEAAKGCSKKVRIRKKDICKPCAGEGAEPGTKRRTCPKCKGTGEVIEVAVGFLHVQVECRGCNGQGSIIDSPCKRCRGSGKVEAEEEITVQIREGVDQDVRLRVPNKGEPGDRGQPPGHVYISVNIKPHPFFTREGADVHLNYPLTVSQAVLGCKIKVPTLDKEQEIALPAGVQPGSTRVLTGHGIRHMDGNRYGNLIVHFQVIVPKNVSREWIRGSDC